MSEIRVKVGDNQYEFDVEATLQKLTGHQTMMLEDYLGGWENFRAPHNQTRSVIALVWLAKHAASEETTLDEIANLPGLVFGNTVEDLDGQSPPAEGSASGDGDAVTADTA